jgi:16S rRNA (cytosine1402-N4)-methyltransferase
MMGRGDGPGAGAAGGPTRHVPVLLAEVCTALDVKRGGTFVDGTFGAGGYTRAILDAHPQNKVVAIDRDPDAIAGGAALVAKFKKRLMLVPGRFGDLDELARSQGFESVDGVVLDIGVSSMQLDQAERGFSFRNEGPLDMRMEQDGPSAADLVNESSEAELADIFYHYGEERRARAVARAIIEMRRRQPFETTRQLADLVASLIRQEPGGIHPATRVFQGLRIAVNDELGELVRALHAAERILAPRGRDVPFSRRSHRQAVLCRPHRPRRHEFAPSAHGCRSRDDLRYDHQRTCRTERAGDGPQPACTFGKAPGRRSHRDAAAGALERHHHAGRTAADS